MYCGNFAQSFSNSGRRILKTYQDRKWSFQSHIQKKSKRLYQKKTLKSKLLESRTFFYDYRRLLEITHDFKHVRFAKEKKILIFKKTFALILALNIMIKN